MDLMRFFRSAVGGKPKLRLYNTLSKTKEDFYMSRSAKSVRMYNCGPTVYGLQHIGNLSMFVFTDVLRRTLEYNGFDVKQVINITDVGHLSSDADQGEDKMTLGLQREGLTLTLENMRTLAEKYTDIFLSDLQQLNIDTSAIQFPRASDHIPGQIAMIKTLEEKGYAYSAENGVYFDTGHFPAYGALGGINMEGQKEGARVAATSGKRHPTDFVLWKRDTHIGWESPWGKGFPGWHIECSAMIRACLGLQIDIHTGGIEHIPIHHNNEIAQSECATGKKPLSRFWLHRAHIQIEGGKIAKSQGNVVYLSEIVKRGFDPLALRYVFLGAHYRTNANFSWEALEASQNALHKLYEYYSNTHDGKGIDNAAQYIGHFEQRINDDLDTPGALAVMWDMTRDQNVSFVAKKAAILEFDTVLGLNIAGHAQRKYIVPQEVEQLLAAREQARAEKNWERSDELRAKIDSMGYSISDTEQGSRALPKK